VRRVPLLLVVALLAGCGSSTEETGVPAGSGQEAQGSGSVPTDTTTLPPEPARDDKLKPPPIILVGSMETQRAEQGSYCVDYVDEATGRGEGVCADMAGPIRPEVVTAVAAGDRVTFVLPEAAFQPESSVTIRPLGCSDQEVGRITLEPGTGEQEWTVDLDSGAYQLDVFARFEADDGRTGDTSGTLGLTVAGSKKWDALGVRSVVRAMAVCPYSD
jgi:hypothetical protein